MKAKYILPLVFLLAVYGCGGSSSGDADNDTDNGVSEEETLAGTYAISSNCELQVETVELTLDGATYVTDDIDLIVPGATYLSFAYSDSNCTTPQFVEPSGPSNCDSCAVSGDTITITVCTSNQCDVTLTRQ